MKTHICGIRRQQPLLRNPHKFQLNINCNVLQATQKTSRFIDDHKSRVGNRREWNIIGVRTSSLVKQILYINATPFIVVSAAYPHPRSLPIHLLPTAKHRMDISVKSCLKGKSLPAPTEIKTLFACDPVSWPLSSYFQNSEVSNHQQDCIIKS